jgi:hypothetical protein
MEIRIRIIPENEARSLSEAKKERKEVDDFNRVSRVLSL